MSSKESSVCIASHVTAEDVTSAKQVQVEVRIKEHKYNLTQGLLEKTKLAQHA
jgi:hypothetical protein